MNAHSRRSMAADAGVFLFGSLLVFATDYVGVPSFAAAGLEPMAAWMLLAIPLVFIPLVLSGIFLLRAEGGEGDWRGRLGLERPSARDWLWGLGGIVGIAAGSAAAFAACASLGLDPNPRSGAA